MGKKSTEIMKKNSMEVSAKTQNGKKVDRAEQSRERILKAAIKIIQSGDLDNFDVRSICAKAGLTTGAFYHLFKSKKDVINYYLSYTFKQYQKKLNSLDDDLNATEKILQIYQHMVASYTQAGYAFLSYFYTPHNPILNFRNRPENEHLILEEVSLYLKEGQREGHFKEDIDLDQALLIIGSIVTGLMFYWCVFKGDMPISELMNERLLAYLKTLQK